MRVALNPVAHGIFHAAERAFESKATAPTAADMARICSEAAGAGGEVVHIDARPDNPPDSVDQLISCANSHSVGWEPRVFDVAEAFAEYEAAKGGWLQRNGRASL